MALNETELIQRYLAPLTEKESGAASLQDDLALITAGPDILLTSDTIVEGVHYLKNDPPASIAKKLLRVNLSDLAAKGGRPIGYMFNATFNHQTTEEWIADFMAGLASDQHHFGFSLLGGDSTIHEGPQVFSITLLGQAQDKVIPRRGGAKPNDLIAVTGRIGEAVLGLALLKGDLAVDDPALRAYLIGRYREPCPRLALGQALVRSGGLHASMDISDGLIGDVDRIAHASGCGAEIELDAIPLPQGFDGWVERMVTGGDDYELLLTFSPDRLEEMQSIVGQEGGILSVIGRMTQGQGVTLRNAKQLPVKLNKLGYQHVFK